MIDNMLIKTILVYAIIIIIMVSVFMMAERVYNYVIETLFNIIFGLLPTKLRQYILDKKILGVKNEIYYQKLINSSLISLENASKDVNQAIIEVMIYAKEREDIINKYSSKLQEYKQMEDELKNRISVLENIPIETIQYFEKVIKISDRKSAKRDIINLIAGALIGVVTSLLIKLL
jgi:hypothetical protein